jgi:hypothetical protein
MENTLMRDPPELIEIPPGTPCGVEGAEEVWAANHRPLSCKMEGLVLRIHDMEPNKYRDELLDAYLSSKMPTHFTPSTQRKT